MTSSYRTARIILATLLLVPLYLIWGLLWALKGLHLLLAGLTYAVALMGADLMRWSYVPPAEPTRPADPSRSAVDYIPHRSDAMQTTMTDEQRQRFVSQEKPEYLLTIDNRALALLMGSSDPGRSLAQLIEAHEQHMAMPDCTCAFSKEKASPIPIGTTGLMVLISDDAEPDEPADHHYIIATSLAPKEIVEYVHESTEEEPLPS